MKRQSRTFALLLSLFVSFDCYAAAKIASQALARIEGAIGSSGSASVIIEYQSLGKSSRSLIGMQGEQRKAAISLVRAEFLSSLSPATAATTARSYSYVNGLSARVNQSQLTELLHNPHVKAIYPNKARKALLAESVNIVYPSRLAPRAAHGSGQMIAVLDTGIDKSHSFFKHNGVTRVISEACYSGGSARPEASSLCPNGVKQSIAIGSGIHCSGFLSCAHGTHVAGIAAGNGGVASDADIMSIQIFTSLKNVADQEACGVIVGSCIRTYESDILAALERVYALRNTYSIAAVNMSIGGGEFLAACDNENPLITSIIGQLKTAGIATIAAAGNDGFSNGISWPACINDVIAVGASADFTGTLLGQPAVIDQRVSYSNVSQQLDIYAPGSFINSALPNERFANLNGTSMATPHVAGAFAILKQINPNTSVARIETLLKSVGPNVTANGVTRRRLDISAAVTRLKSAFMPAIELLLIEN